MESALVAIISIALLLYGGLMVVRTTLSSVDLVSESVKEMYERGADITRTEVGLGAVAALNPGRTVATVTVSNSGQVSFHSFSEWDVMVQYYDDSDVLHIVRAGYSQVDPPGDGGWTNLAPTPATFEPGILNPGEQVQIKVQVSPAIKAGSDFLVAAATSNGATTSRTYTA